MVLGRLVEAARLIGGRFHATVEQGRPPARINSYSRLLTPPPRSPSLPPPPPQPCKVCSEILPYLFVSGVSVTSNRPLLEKHGITHILNCAGDVIPNSFPDVRLKEPKAAAMCVVFGT